MFAILVEKKKLFEKWFLDSPKNTQNRLLPFKYRNIAMILFVGKNKIMLKPPLSHRSRTHVCDILYNLYNVFVSKTK